MTTKLMSDIASRFKEGAYDAAAAECTAYVLAYIELRAKNLGVEADMFTRDVLRKGGETVERSAELDAMAESDR